MKLVRERWGMVSALVFTLGLLSFCGRSSVTNTEHAALAKKWNVRADSTLIPNTIRTLQVTLDETLIAQFDLRINYGTDPLSLQKVPSSVYATTNGLVLGSQWQPEVLSTTPLKEGIQYTVTGTYDWKFLGYPVYSQAKTYTGFAKW